jgi:hypothetical protein
MVLYSGRLRGTDVDLTTYGCSKISCIVCPCWLRDTRCFQNALAYFASAVSFTCKRFVKLTLGANFIKHFTGIIYEFLEKAGAFFPGKPFQRSLMFVGNAGAYPREVQVLHSRVPSRPYLQTLDLAGKSCQGQTLEFLNSGKKCFITLGPGWLIGTGRNVL